MFYLVRWYGIPTGSREGHLSGRLASYNSIGPGTLFSFYKPISSYRIFLLYPAFYKWYLSIHFKSTFYELYNHCGVYFKICWNNKNSKKERELISIILPLSSGCVASIGLIIPPDKSHKSSPSAPNTASAPSHCPPWPGTPQALPPDRRRHVPWSLLYRLNSLSSASSGR